MFKVLESSIYMAQYSKDSNPSVFRVVGTSMRRDVSQIRKKAEMIDVICVLLNGQP